LIQPPPSHPRFFDSRLLNHISFQRRGFSPSLAELPRRGLPSFKHKGLKVVVA
jgi:hypothetical protein